jgi:hypothetical protein
MQNLNVNKVAMVTGTMAAGFHLGWSALVFFGLAQPLIDLIFSLHMIVPFVTVLSFNFTTFVELIIFTYLVGYLLGWSGATVWNMIHKR